MSEKQFQAVVGVPYWYPALFIESLQGQGTVRIEVTIEAKDRKEATRRLAEASESWEPGSAQTEPDWWAVRLGRGRTVKP